MKIPVLKKDSVLLQDYVETGFLVLINKPVGWTSFDVCKKIRRIANIKKVGHAGTLDPFATGLMVIGVGKGTKLLSSFLNSSKKYRAVIEFGKSTDSYDITGEITKQTDNFNLELTELSDTVKQFTGKISQVPPMYSAKKIGGKPLYKYARKGLELQREAVPVEIYKAEIKKWEKPYLELMLHVSKGTYIRSYANDLGETLNIPAVLKELERTQIDSYKLEESFRIEEFEVFWAKVAA